jgi:hypothetical protein
LKPGESRRRRTESARALTIGAGELISHVNLGADPVRSSVLWLQLRRRSFRRTLALVPCRRGKRSPAKPSIHCRRQSRPGKRQGACGRCGSRRTDRPSQCRDDQPRSLGRLQRSARYRASSSRDAAPWSSSDDPARVCEEVPRPRCTRALAPTMKFRTERAFKAALSRIGGQRRWHL